MCEVRFSFVLCILAGLISLMGCTSLILHDEPESAPTGAGAGLASGTLASATGCSLDYRFYPAEPQPGAGPACIGGADPGFNDALVILGHGFLRSQERMQGMADSLAAQGIPVATVDFCNMRFWDGRHQQNGLDMIALANHLSARSGATRVVYSGFSAGGLAALVAARNDPNAVGVVTLDLVDAQGIGERAAVGLDTPLVGLAGEPTNCNAANNAQRVFAATKRAKMEPIAGAGHCDFEAPTDALCELVCEDPDQAAPARTATLREQIISRATAEIGSMLATGTDRPTPARTSSARTSSAQSESLRSDAEPGPS